MGKVIFSPQAIERLEEIVRYVAEDNRDAAVRLGMRLIERAEFLAEFPQS
jgi:toxin ParE1/3/4